MTISRRTMLKSTAAALAAPYFVPARALGKDGFTAPSNRIVFASVGWGMQGPSNTKKFLSFDDCQVVAICDLDGNHLYDGVKTVNEKYKNKDCKGYHDYREMLARKDIDAVCLSVPDHWHALVATEAAKNRKDIWGEKPLAKTFREQQAIVKAVQDNKVIWQTGSWQRSTFNFHDGVELVRNGLIGKINRVEVGLPAGHKDFARTGEYKQPTPPPEMLDYNMWLGPSKQEPYIEARVHKNWRWNYNTGGGQLMDWVGHHVDIAHWGLGFDDTGPTEVEGNATFPSPTDVWNTATKYRITAKYEGGVEMIIAGGHDDIQSGTKWIGDEGWVYVNRGKFDASNKEWLKKGFMIPDQKVTIYRSKDHWGNLVDCIKSRLPTIAPVEVAHRSATPGHLGYIATKLGRKIRWDPRKEEIIGDAEATKMLGRDYRKPWAL